MRKFFSKLMIVLEEMGKARAATYLANMGHYEEAQTLMRNIK